MDENNIHLGVTVDGHDNATPQIQKAEKSFDQLVASFIAGQKSFHSAALTWVKDLENIALSAQETAGVSEKAMGRLEASISASTRRISGGMGNVFTPLATSAELSSDKASASVTKLRSKIALDVDEIKAATVKAFEPLTAGMASASAAVTAGMADMVDAVKIAKTQVAELGAELRGLKTPAIVPGAPRGSGRGSLRSRSREGGGPHISAEGIKGPGFHVSPGSGPVMAAAGTAGYAIILAAKARDEAIKTALTSQGEVKALDVRLDEYASMIMDIAAETGESIQEVGAAVRGVIRNTQGLAPAKRIEMIQNLKQRAYFEAFAKDGSSFRETLPALAELGHMFNEYSPDGIKKLASKFAVASPSSEATIPELQNTLSYSAPVLRGFGFNDDSILAMTTALKNAGINSTKSGTWMKDFWSSMLYRDMRHPNGKKQMAKNRLGVGDPSAWLVHDDKGGIDGIATSDRVVDILQKHLAGMNESQKATALKGAFGEQGSNVANLMAFSKYKDNVDTTGSQIRDGSEQMTAFNDIADNSTMMQMNKAWRETQNLLISIGNDWLPKVNIALTDFERIIKELKDVHDGNYKALWDDFYQHAIKPDVDVYKRHYATQIPDDRAERSRPGDAIKPSWWQRAAQWVERNNADAGGTFDGLKPPPKRDSAPSQSWTDWAADQYVPMAYRGDEGLLQDGLARGGPGTKLRSAGDLGMTTALRIWAAIWDETKRIREDIERPGDMLRRSFDAATGGGMGGKLINASFGSSGSGGIGGGGVDTSGVTLPGFSGKAEPGKWWTPDRREHAIQRLMAEAHVTREGAEGLVARWATVESPGGPMSVNPKSGAAGIAQWLGKRKHGFTGDYDSQISHVIDELNGPEKRAGDALRRARTAEEGARGASMYERAEGYNGKTGIDNFTGKTVAGIRAMHRKVMDTAEKAKPKPFRPSAPAHDGKKATIAESVAGSGVVRNSGETTHNWHIKATDPRGTAREILATQDDFRRAAMLDLKFT